MRKTKEAKHIIDTSTHFKDVAEDYDFFVHTTVPKYDELNEELSKLLDKFLLSGNKPEILDLGIGAGATSKLVFAKSPSAHIIGYDISPEMLEKAKANLHGYNVELVLDNVLNIEYNNKFDLAISSIACHHLTDEEKQACFKKVFNSLKPNGVFILSDVMTTGNPTEDEEIAKQWGDFMEKRAGAEYRDFILADAEKSHMPASIDANIAFLKELGFENVQFVWRGMITAIVHGIKGMRTNE